MPASKNFIITVWEAVARHDGGPVCAKAHLNYVGVERTCALQLKDGQQSHTNRFLAPEAADVYTHAAAVS